MGYSSDLHQENTKRQAILLQNHYIIESQCVTGRYHYQRKATSCQYLKHSIEKNTLLQIFSKVVQVFIQTLYMTIYLQGSTQFSSLTKCMENMQTNVHGWMDLVMLCLATILPLKCFLYRSNITHHKCISRKFKVNSAKFLIATRPKTHKTSH